jgi:xanthine dehydrogenase small subunit
MRDHLVVYVNGHRHAVTGQDAFLSLSEFLRTRLRLTGTKIVCSEGDCGSCSVLVGRLQDGEIVYRAIDSCIQFLFQLDGTHVVTVEGLRLENGLSPVQQAMVTHHGSQCGYCTPGFVVTMTGLLERQAELDEEAWRCGLTGNLCRCTGYASILEAGRQAAIASHKSLAELYPAQEMCAEFLQLRQEPLTIQDGGRRVFSPIEMGPAIKFLTANPTAKIVAGGTDVGVQLNKRTIAPDLFLDLNRVTELTGVELDDDEIVCGARAAWVDLEAICRERAPEFGDIIAIFGSPQIRHVGTIGGNIVNASPIADSLPFLFVMEAELEIGGPKGSRTINIHDFYHGYRKTDLKPGELLTRVRIPLPTSSQHLSLYKVSRRRDLDIATFTAAILVELSDEEIVQARVALGAVGPTVLRARKTEAFLRNKMLSEAVMQEAGEIAVEEISPISDVRGSADFRWQLTRNIFLKWFHEFRHKDSRGAA